MWATKPGLDDDFWAFAERKDRNIHEWDMFLKTKNFQFRQHTYTHTVHFTTHISHIYTSPVQQHIHTHRHHIHHTYIYHMKYRHTCTHMYIHRDTQKYPYTCIHTERLHIDTHTHAHTQFWIKQNSEKHFLHSPTFQILKWLSPKENVALYHVGTQNILKRKHNNGM